VQLVEAKSHVKIGGRSAPPILVFVMCVLSYDWKWKEGYFRSFLTVERDTLHGVWFGLGLT
jgi:hypothetical protein